MIRPGDRVEWKGFNRTQTGIVTESDNGELHVRLDAVHSFPLPILLGSKSLKVYGKETHESQESEPPQ